jgi:hypothetical protein
MLNPPLRILIVAGLCIAGLVGLVVNESIARDRGVETLLPMEAVDPRSLLSGHYVIVQLRETIEPGAPCFTNDENAQWVALTPNGETVNGAAIYSLAAAAPTRAEVPTTPSAVLARGSFYCAEPTAPADGFAGSPGWIDLSLGIDRFHINQAEAERIDRVLRTRGEQTKVHAIVSIGEDGRARLQGLMVDGERLDLGWN